MMQNSKPKFERSINSVISGENTMRVGKAVLAAFLGVCLASVLFAAPAKGPAKKRILVVESYNREYPWTQETNKGFCAALLKFGYLDDQAQIAECTGGDHVESSRAVIQKIWMDARQKSSKTELTKTTVAVTRIARKFRPDIIFLGDEEAGKYIGNEFLDTRTPVVFWGFSNNPVKYGLIDTAERPGHNITGVYLAGSYRESLQLLKRLAPGVKTFAILTDDSPSGRAREKGIEFLSRQGVLPIKLIGTLATNDFERWKEGALALQKMVDAFFVGEYSTLKDRKGETVSTGDVARWYSKNIKIPEATLGFYVKQGLLCAADEPGYDQAFEAVSIGRDFLERRSSPATYPARATKRGALIINARRARALGIAPAKQTGMEEFDDEDSSLASPHDASPIEGHPE